MQGANEEAEFFLSAPVSGLLIYKHALAPWTRSEAMEKQFS